MADLLNRAPGAYVFHEAVLEDIPAHMRAHFSAAAAESYMQGFRKKEIYARMRGTASGVYGEVNGHLRCHAQAIQHAFPGAVLIHLIRDGRDVVRSTMPRRMMTLRNPFSLRIQPEASDPWHDRWSKMDRFERICWYWQEENRRLRVAIGKPVHFERILSSYAYLCEEVLGPCGIELEEPVWRSAVNSPQNVTPRHQMPKWDDWTPQQQRTFREICGEEMMRSDPWAGHALYEAASLAARVPGSKVTLLALAPKQKLQQVMMAVGQKVPFELLALDGSSSGFTDAHEVSAKLAEAVQKLPGLDRSALLLFGGWESASRGAG